MLQQFGIEIGLACIHVAIEPQQFRERPIIRLNSQLDDKHSRDHIPLARTTFPRLMVSSMAVSQFGCNLMEVSTFDLQLIDMQIGDEDIPGFYCRFIALIRSSRRAMGKFVPSPGRQFEISIELRQS